MSRCMQCSSSYARHAASPRGTHASPQKKKNQFPDTTISPMGIVNKLTRERRKVEYTSFPDIRFFLSSAKMQKNTVVVKVCLVHRSQGRPERKRFSLFSDPVVLVFFLFPAKICSGPKIVVNRGGGGMLQIDQASLQKKINDGGRVGVVGVGAFPIALSFLFGQGDRCKMHTLSRLSVQRTARIHLDTSYHIMRSRCKLCIALLIRRVRLWQ